MNGHAKWVIGAISVGLLALAGAGAKGIVDPADRKAEQARETAVRAEVKAEAASENVLALERVLGQKTTDIEVIKTQLQAISASQSEMKQDMRELKRLLEQLTNAR